jgi:hypothetical protein
LVSSSSFFSSSFFVSSFFSLFSPEKIRESKVLFFLGKEESREFGGDLECKVGFANCCQLLESNQRTESQKVYMGCLFATPFFLPYTNLRLRVVK